MSYKRDRWQFWKWKHGFGLIANLNELVRSIGWFYTHECSDLKQKVVQLKLREIIDKTFNFEFVPWHTKCCSSNNNNSYPSRQTEKTIDQHVTLCCQSNHFPTKIDDSVKTKRWLFRTSLTHDIPKCFTYLSIKPKCECEYSHTKFWNGKKTNERKERKEMNKKKPDGKELNVFTFDMWYALNRNTN